jgi:hypothetical protein
MQNSRRRPVIVWILGTFLLVGGSANAFFPQGAPDEKLLALVDELVPVVVRLRGLEPKSEIQKGVKNREEISRALDQMVRDQVNQEDLRGEGILLKKLGLIPAGMDYSGFVLKLLTEQVGGYYDTEKKILYIAGWLPAEQQRPVMVHELTHALQDQYFDLDALTKKDAEAHNSDMALAHHALAEGDATAVMLDSILEPIGRSFVQLPDLVFIMQSQMPLMNSQFEVFNSAPDFIKETLLFPYSYGTAFLQKVRANDKPWSAVNRIYADLPSSTEQIMHPSKYLEERDEPKPVEIEDPAAAMGKDWKVTYRNVFGEFSLYLLLKLNQTDQAAMNSVTGWGGDQVILVEQTGGGQAVVFLNTVWDNNEYADRYYDALSAWLKRRWPQARKAEESENVLALTAGGERHSIRRQGTSVQLIVGLPESLAGSMAGR